MLLDSFLIVFILAAVLSAIRLQNIGRAGMLLCCLLPATLLLDNMLGFTLAARA
jgi:hypothetical protein